MELHCSRGNHELFELVRAFIKAGEYPQWPNRGAEKLETIFTKQGIRGIRAAIEGRVRSDPETTQAVFDSTE